LYVTFKYRQSSRASEPKKKGMPQTAGNPARMTIMALDIGTNINRRTAIDALILREKKEALASERVFVFFSALNLMLDPSSASRLVFSPSPQLS
jgi:hypothetical protein